MKESSGITRLVLQGSRGFFCRPSVYVRTEDKDVERIFIMTKWDTRDMSVNLANDGWTTCKRPDELSNGSLSDQNR